jgi:hypothetical protein
MCKNGKPYRCKKEVKVAEIKLGYPVKAEFYRDTKINKFPRDRFCEILRCWILSPHGSIYFHRGPS